MSQLDSRLTRFFCMLAGAFALVLAHSTVVTAEEGGEPTSGQLAFNNHCRTCHSLDPDDNRSGPTLSGIIGRKSGSIDGFGYSATLAQGDLTWDETTLDAFIGDPDKVAPGHKMQPFGGINDAEVRAQIIEFLKTNS